MPTRKAWKVEYWTSVVLPNLVKFRHAGTYEVASTRTQAEFKTLRAWWTAEYGEGQESVNAQGHTVLTFQQQDGKEFRLVPKTDWGKVYYY